MNIAAKATRATAQAERIKSLLAGLGPDIQGAVLAELVAVYVAGHRKDARETVLALWLDCMHDLVPIVEREMFGDGPRPEGW